MSSVRVEKMFMHKILGETKAFLSDATVPVESFDSLYTYSMLESVSPSRFMVERLSQENSQFQQFYELSKLFQ